jgi:hypothetical protein
MPLVMKEEACMSDFSGLLGRMTHIGISYITNKSASIWIYRCSFHPRVFKGIESIGNVCTSLLAGSSKDNKSKVGKDGEDSYGLRVSSKDRFNLYLLALGTDLHLVCQVSPAISSTPNLNMGEYKGQTWLSPLAAYLLDSAYQRQPQA